MEDKWQQQCPWALKAFGVSLWLAVEEAAAQPAEKTYLNASSEDTIRSKAWTGKPARMLKNKWTEAWKILITQPFNALTRNDGF